MNRKKRRKMGIWEGTRRQDIRRRKRRDKEKEKEKEKEEREEGDEHRG